MIDLQYVLIYYPQIILFLDYFGTVAFAITGAFKAIEQKADIVGVIILSSVTGLAGGLMRDVIFGKYPPTALSNPMYLDSNYHYRLFYFFPVSSIEKTLEYFSKMRCDRIRGIHGNWSKHCLLYLWSKLAPSFHWRSDNSYRGRNTKRRPSK